jgi:16S rRNA (guanine966-N2)-methyltransferase
MGCAMRITGGTQRSRVIAAPRGVATRPTTDRVREALFSALTSRAAIFPGAHVLDLYAGSGALSFESLSRGAADAVLVEKDRVAVACIRENASALRVEPRVRVLPVAVDKALPKLDAGAFDLVLADPPYVLVASADFAACLRRAADLLTQEGWLVLEHGKRDAPPVTAGLIWEETRHYGDTCISLARPAAER